MLQGIRVVDFSQYLAGPACTRLMVEQGADCIKLELPDHGDPSRGLQPRINRRSAFFVQQNRGKRSVGLDFRTDAGRQIALDLVATADVVVENFSPGVMARYGLAYRDLIMVKPDLVMASISGSANGRWYCRIDISSGRSGKPRDRVGCRRLRM